ncbi:hypothetical protein HanXRQr2_Chr01g0029711 [Helianthus annuus]|uniref:Uncharacterized protein n=1 Tax=Helianthus annuus TaxID=4232 RepID=A0A9K3JW05_HELAN|nr:hypothetical protein HanXRQr2_Chr01g0029711 [Helianthus annuus]KAJ0957575.1 hypothetical protein HanPSC8_Chr01g0028961 [Helianthus annuus]
MCFSSNQRAADIEKDLKVNNFQSMCMCQMVQLNLSFYIILPQSSIICKSYVAILVHNMFFLGTEK